MKAEARTIGTRCGRFSDPPKFGQGEAEIGVAIFQARQHDLGHGPHQDQLSRQRPRTSRRFPAFGKGSEQEPAEPRGNSSAAIASKASQEAKVRPRP